MVLILEGVGGMVIEARERERNFLRKNKQLEKHKFNFRFLE